jgi:molybdopterin-binding protein
MHKLSARNQLAGKVVEVRKGQTTSHVRIDIGSGVVVTASITTRRWAIYRLPKAMRSSPSSRHPM